MRHKCRAFSTTENTEYTEWLLSRVERVESEICAHGDTMSEYCGVRPHFTSYIAICDGDSSGKQHDETPTVYKTPSLPLRPMLRAPQPRNTRVSIEPCRTCRNVQNQGYAHIGMLWGATPWYLNLMIYILKRSQRHRRIAGSRLRDGREAECAGPLTPPQAPS